MGEADSTVSLVTMDTFNDTNTTNTTSLEIYEYPEAWKLFIIYLASGGAALANFTVFYTVPKLKGKIKASTRYAMLNLAITDTMLGFGSLILRSIYLVSPKLFMDHFCKIDGIFSTFLVSLSIIGLAFLNLDKFLNLLLPLKYKVWMTGKKALVALASMWLFYIVLFTFSSLPPEPLLKPELVEGAFICLPNYTKDLLMTSLAILLQQVFPSTVCIASLIGMYSIIRRRKHSLGEGRSTARANERTLVFTIFLLTCSYFLMCTPFFIFVIFWGMATGAPLSPTMSFLSIWIGGANSFVNPLIYIPSLRSYRYYLKQAICPQPQRKDSIRTLREYTNNSSESRI